MPPVKHALLSASSASRWLVCTAAPRFEEGLPESTSEYAEEGRLAHAIGELKVTKKCTPMSTRTYNTRLNKLKKDPLYTPEMDKTTDLYLEHITEQVMAYDTAPTVAVEVQVDFSDYVPGGFGTCDCCIIGGDLLSIVDYKHGKGVPVSAVGNPQMRLYALGALHRYAPVFGDTIKRVRMTIDQPRLDSYTTDEITVEELRAWGESIKPIAQKAFSGLGEFVPGDHCRFCRGKAQCRARANINTALEDFKDCVPAGAWNEKAEAFVSAGGVVTGAPPPLLTDAEIGDLLERGAHLVQWYKDLEAYATEALLAGKEIPGWKLVAGRSNRTFTDQDAAIQAVIAAGYDIGTCDGMNEKGLVASLLFLPESVYHRPGDNRPIMGISIWTQYVLDNFATVREAVDELKKESFRIDAPDLPNGAASTLHLAITDETGNTAVLEYIDGNLEIHEGKQYQVMTNSPKYELQLAINDYWKEVGGLNMLPGTNRSSDRFVRASFYINAIPQTADAKIAVPSVLSVMRNVSVPFGITTPDKPHISSTRWRSVSDQKNKVYYFESTLTPNLFWLDLKKIDFSPNAGIKKLSLTNGEIYAGDAIKDLKDSKGFVFLFQTPVM